MESVSQTFDPARIRTILRMKKCFSADRNAKEPHQGQNKSSHVARQIGNAFRKRGSLSKSVMRDALSESKIEVNSPRRRA
jgi:hypothetical protein